MHTIKELYKNTQELNLLLVEDNEEFRNTIMKVFTELFKSVDFAQNGEIGLNKFKTSLEQDNTPFDIVITDINMPVMNGIEMIEKIYEINPEQPIVVTSAHNDTHYLVDLLNLGIDSFVIKPIQEKSLMNTLYKISTMIINKRLVKSNNEKINELNKELMTQTNELTKINKDLKYKNIALEKSMRIIEGLYQKHNLDNNATTFINEQKNGINQKEKISCIEYSQDLKNIENTINEIALIYHYRDVEKELLEKLSYYIISYSGSLPKEELYKPLVNSLNILASIVCIHPRCKTIQKLERVYSMLESFFFIYIKWQNKWASIDNDNFISFSTSIENEIKTLNDIWKCEA